VFVDHTPPDPGVQVLRRALAIGTALAVCVPVAAAVAEPVSSTKLKPAAARMSCVGRGRERTCTVPLPAGVKVRHRTVRVVLPAGYDSSRASYPVVFMLHGVGDDESAWTNPKRGDLVRLTAACPAIFVMPDGGSGREAGWYSDWLDGSFQYETYDTKVLPRAVDATFRTTGPRRRAVAGMSMGGFGALSLAARHRGLYRAVASYSAFADTTFLAPVSGVGYQASGQNDVYSTGAPSDRVWGDQVADADVWSAHNPYDHVDALRGMPVYLSGGSGVPSDPTPALSSPTVAGSYAVEAYVRRLIDRFADRMDARGVRFTDARSDKGAHDWANWRMNFTKSLRVLMPPLRAARRGCGA
jgi:S-formylglutathione hydrolase FrmB